VAEAFRVKGRDGYLASVQAVIRVNAEKGSKPLRQEPTLRFSEEGRSRWGGTSEWEKVPSDSDSSRGAYRKFSQRSSDPGMKTKSANYRHGFGIEIL
jgi:hypothetical protein